MLSRNSITLKVSHKIYRKYVGDCFNCSLKGYNFYFWLYFSVERFCGQIYNVHMITQKAIDINLMFCSVNRKYKIIKYLYEEMTAVIYLNVCSERWMYIQFYE